jgi:hypothetical protein
MVIMGRLQVAAWLREVLYDFKAALGPGSATTRRPGIVSLLLEARRSAAWLVKSLAPGP